MPVWTRDHKDLRGRRTQGGTLTEQIRERASTRAFDPPQVDLHVIAKRWERSEQNNSG